MHNNSKPPSLAKFNSLFYGRNNTKQHKLVISEYGPYQYDTASMVFDKQYQIWVQIKSLSRIIMKKKIYNECFDHSGIHIDTETVHWIYIIKCNVNSHFLASNMSNHKVYNLYFVGQLSLIKIQSSWLWKDIRVHLSGRHVQKWHPLFTNKSCSTSWISIFFVRLYTLITSIIFARFLLQHTNTQSQLGILY